MDLLLLSNGNVQFKDFAIGMSADAVIEILTFKELDYSRHSNDHKPGYNLIVPNYCLLYTSPSPRDRQKSRMPSSA